MDSQATKIELASFILDLQNPDLIEKIKNLIYGNVDIYDELSTDQKEQVQLGIQQAKEGETTPWEEVEQLLKQR
jgi:hypothetical protein|tara:strand:- start:6752 stop:6973 length:222 start_codon:yes stop_codon:yes gene_type:complete